MRSLRLRFFVVVWLFVVAAMVALAALLGKWSLTEIDRIAVETRVDRRIDSLARPLRDALEALPLGDSVALSAALARVTRGDTTLLGAAVLDAQGRVLGSSIPGLTAGALTLMPGGAASFRQSVAANGVTRRVLLAIPGHSFERAGMQNTLVLIPALRSAAMTSRISGRSPSDDLSRRIVIAVLVGSLLSAVVTLLIARPLLGRVEELSRATAALREGKLDSRVPVRGNDEVADLGRSFNELASSLEASEAQRRRMVTDVAHELRTPLTNIIGLLEAARDGIQPIDDAVLGALREEAASLNHLVDDLRDLSLADAGELTLALESLDAGAAARAAVAAFPVQPDAARIVVEASSPALQVVADRRRLGQVLRNLLQNARRHAPVDSVIVLRVALASGRVRFEVIDQGEGIAAEHLPHLFERFYRVDPSRDKTTGGMGLGLALVQRLVEAQGGRVGVESQVGKGSTFWVTLPRGSQMERGTPTIRVKGMTTTAGGSAQNL
ncbi:MAG: ATP-binding protein [Gemmatimonadota bacterium]